MCKILFYGDSNTYGYDPSDFGEGRYPAQYRWTDILAKEFSVIAEGMNGRRVPDMEKSPEYVESLLRRLGEEDVFAVMLGTNDLLSSAPLRADEAIRRMDLFLKYVTERRRPDRVLVIAPVFEQEWGSLSPSVEEYLTQSKRMNRAFAEQAALCGTLFVDPQPWRIRLAYDHVHFSEEGSLKFAEEMAKVLRAVMKSRRFPSESAL